MSSISWSVWLKIGRKFGLNATSKCPVTLLRNHTCLASSCLQTQPPIIHRWVMSFTPRPVQPSTGDQCWSLHLAQTELHRSSKMRSKPESHLACKSSSWPIVWMPCDSAYALMEIWNGLATYTPPTMHDFALHEGECEARVAQKARLNTPCPLLSIGLSRLSGGHGTA